MVVVEVLVWLRHGVGMVWVRHGMALARFWYGADIVVERFGVALVWFWFDFGMALAWLCGVWLRYCAHTVFVWNAVCHWYGFCTLEMRVGHRCGMVSV